jgi:hypothetical protein
MIASVPAFAETVSCVPNRLKPRAALATGLLLNRFLGPYTRWTRANKMP